MATLKLGSTTVLTETGGALTIGVSNPTVTLGSNTTFPAGHVTKAYYFKDVAGDMSTTSASPVIACVPMSFTTVSGRIYIIKGTQSIATSNESGVSRTSRTAGMGLYYGTTSRAKSDSTVDTLIYASWMGRTQSANSTAGYSGYYSWPYTGYFTAASSATHYVYTTIQDNAGDSLKMYGHGDIDNPHLTVIFEVMP
jgi:hypothetical protein